MELWKIMLDFAKNVYMMIQHEAINLSMAG